MFRIAMAVVLVAAIVGVGVSLSAPPTVAQQTPSATRSFDETTVEPGENVTVTIIAGDYGGVGAVTEILPEGFSYVTSDLDTEQVTEVDARTVRFTLRGDSRFTYTVTASSEEGSHIFSGTLRDDARQDHTVGGATRVTVKAVAPPPDEGPSATRSFDETTVEPGENVTVIIIAGDYGGVGAVTEILPEGFSYVTSDLDTEQVTEVDARTVRFTLRGDSRFTYTVTASSEEGSHIFSGTLRDDARQDHTVGGATRVTVKAVAPPPDEGPSATRSFDETTVEPGENVTVTIIAGDYGGVGAVTEILPEGFSYVTSDLDTEQVTEVDARTVRFTLRGDSRFTYTVTASSEEGSHIFSGTLRDDARQDHTVGGATRVTVKAVAPPPVEPVTPPPNTRPVFRSAAAFNVAENTTAVGRVIATDRDSQDTVTGYSIRGGADSGKFSIVAATGALSFTTAPDFENPADAGANNEYVVLVRAASGDGAAGRAMTTTQAITVTVTDVNEEPTFAGETADREVRENSAEGAPVGAPVAATDADAGDTLTYSLGGTDAASFAIDSATGQLMTMAPLDYETMMIYMVMVQVSDNEDDMGNADTAVDDSIAVTINVTNMEEMGEVTFSAQPVVGTEVTASVTDPDVVDQDTVTWQWASSDAMDGTFTDIADATDASYMPVAGDEDMYLQATATYEDGEGSSRNAMAVSEIVVSHSSPAFAEDAATAIDVAEDTAVGGNVGDPYTATDGDGDTPVYALSGADAASFTIDSMGQLMTVAALDYETTMTYMVTVEVRDDEDAIGAPITGEDADAMVDVTINVTNVEEPGTVTLDSDQPVADTALMATLDDPDGGVTGVTWQWASSDAMDGTFDDIAGAMSDTYTPAAGDAGMYLMVTASYTDAEGPNKSAEAVSANAVTATPTTGTGSVVGDRYDANGDGVIQKSEAIAAVFDYFDRKIDKPDAIEVIMLYIANS